MDKQTIIDELRRVASEQHSNSLSRSTFDKHATIGTTVVEKVFGSWNAAIKAAGLIPMPPGGIPRTEQRRAERVK